jgi:hypothetical protein
MVPRLAHVGDAGAVIDCRRLHPGELVRHRVAIEQIHGAPEHAGSVVRVPPFGQVRPSAAMGPGRNHLFAVEEMVYEVATRKSGGARDQRRTRHGRCQARGAPYWAS